MSEEVTWSISYICGDNLSPNSYELKVANNGHIEKRTRHPKTGEQIIEPLGDDFDNAQDLHKILSQNWSSISEVRATRTAVGRKIIASEQETLVYRQGMKRFNWDFPRDSPPERVVPFYIEVKNFFSQWIQ